VGIGVDAVLAWDPLTNRDHGPPFGKTGAQFPVFYQAFTQTIEPLGDLLTRMARHIFCTLVYLDPGDDAGLV
jgi:hypothetical protein